MTEPTIIAPASAPGRGGVSVVRISGPKARPIAKTLCGDLEEPRKLKKCTIRGKGGVDLDTGLVVFFKSPTLIPGKMWLSCTVMATQGWWI